MTGSSVETKYKNPTAYKIYLFLALAAVGIVGSNLMRVFQYSNTPLFVAFILIWILSFVTLTALFFVIYKKYKINPWLSILTLLTPLISIVIYVVMAKDQSQVRSQ